MKIHSYYHFYYVSKSSSRDNREGKTVPKAYAENKKGSALERANHLETGPMDSTEASFLGEYFFYIHSLT